MSKPWTTWLFKKKNNSCRGLEHLVFIYLLFIHKEMKATHQWVWIDSCHSNSHSSYWINLSNCSRVGRVQEHWCIFIFTDVDGHSGVGTLMGNTIITGLYSQLQNRMTKLYTLCQSFFHVIFPTFFSPNFYQFLTHNKN